MRCLLSQPIPKALPSSSSQVILTYLRKAVHVICRDGDFFDLVKHHDGRRDWEI